MTRPFFIAQDMVHDRRKPGVNPRALQVVGITLLIEALIGWAGLWMWRLWR